MILQLALFAEALILLCSISGLINSDGWVLLGLIPAAVIAVALAVELPAGKTGPSRPYASRAVWLAAQIVCFLVMWQVAVRLVPHYTWDWGRLVQDAIDYSLSGQLENTVYYARYPNNQFWFSVLAAFCQACVALNPGADASFLLGSTITLACLLLQLTVCFIRVAAELIWGAGRRSFAIWLFSLAFVPFWQYSPFAYSDAPAALICSIVLVIHLRARAHYAGGSKARFAMCCCVLGVLAALAFKVKIMVLIVVVAIGVATALECSLSRILAAGAICFAVAFGVAMAACSAFASAYIETTSADSDAYEFPAVHWVMMSQDYGGYVSKDVGFTASFATKAERREADSAELRRRLEERGLLGSLQHATITKAVRQYGDGTLAGSDYVSRDPIHPKSVFQRLLSKEGDLHYAILPYAWICHIALLLGALMAAWVFLGGEEPRHLLFFPIAVLGIYLFFSIWECNPRYLLPFSPLLIVGSLSGWFFFRDMVAHRRYKRL